MIIGIDPDTDKSGVSIVFDSGLTKLLTMPLWEIYWMLHTYREEDPYVVIEAGWKNNKSLSFVTGRKRAVDVGRNHAIGQQIEAFCIEKKIPHELFVPTHRTPKWDHAMMVKLTGVDAKRSNQEERDALRAVYFSSNGKEIFQ